MHTVTLSLLLARSILPSLVDFDDAKRSQLLRTLMFSCFFGMTVLAGLFISTGIYNALAPTGSHDFQWTPAKDIVDGISPYRDFIIWEQQANESVPPHFLNQSPSYPASTYILLSPFAHTDWQTAKAIWVVANLVFIGLFLLGLQKTFPVSSPTILASLVLAFLIASPLRTSLGAGQHNLISLAAFIWAYYFANNGKNKGLSGLLLSVAWIKYSITFPLTLIFLRRGTTTQPVVIAAGIHAVLTCVAAWRIGMWPHEFFFDSVKVVLMGDGTGFLNLIALSMNLNLPLQAPLTLIAIATAVIGFMVYRNRDADPLMVLAFLGLFSCAVFFHHGYDFVVLLLCAWALAKGHLQGTAIRYATVSLLGIAWVGQWLAQELAGQLGVYLVMVTDALLIMAFYYTSYLFAKALYQPAVKLESSAAVSF